MGTSLAGCVPAGHAQVGAGGCPEWECGHCVRPQEVRVGAHACGSACVHSLNTLLSVPQGLSLPSCFPVAFWPAPAVTAVVYCLSSSGGSAPSHPLCPDGLPSTPYSLSSLQVLLQASLNDWLQSGAQGRVNGFLTH